MTIHAEDEHGSAVRRPRCKQLSLADFARVVNCIDCIEDLHGECEEMDCTEVQTCPSFAEGSRFLSYAYELRCKTSFAAHATGRQLAGH